MNPNPLTATLRAMRSDTPPQGVHRMPSELFRPAIEQLASQLGDIGDATSSILAELARDPTAERAERAQHHLRGVQAYVAQVREAARQKAA